MSLFVFQVRVGQASAPRTPAHPAEMAQLVRDLISGYHDVLDNKSGKSVCLGTPPPDLLGPSWAPTHNAGVYEPGAERRTLIGRALVGKPQD